MVGLGLLAVFKSLAVEESPQHFVLVFAHRSYHLHNAGYRDTHQQQHVRSDHQASFQAFRNDFGRTRFHQSIDINVINRANDDRHLRARGPGYFKYLQRCRHIAETDRHCRRARQARGLKYIAAGTVTIHDCFTGIPSITHAHRIEIKREALDVLLFQ